MTDVTIVGLGPMGRALAAAQLNAGRTVTVWNRSPGKADELVDAGARLAGSPAEALAASPLAVTCLIDDDAVGAVLAQAGPPPEGLTLVNLTADSPERTRRLAADVAGATFVDGAIMTPAATIGADAARVLYSGPPEAFERHRGVLATFGAPHYLGPDIAAAATYDVALLTLFWTSFAGAAQSLALIEAEGLPLDEFAPHAAAMSGLMADLLPGLAADLGERRFSGEASASIDSMAASVTHLREALGASGLATGVLDAVGALAGQALRSGHGTEAPIRLAETLRREPAAD